MGAWIDAARRDLRQALRVIVRMPVLATVVIVSLGVGIGVNTVVFSWIQGVVLRPLPGVDDATSYHLVEPRTDTGLFPGTSWLEYRELADELGCFRGLLAFRMVPLYVGEPGHVERSYGLLVSGNYFTALGLRPALGRFLLPEEVTRPGSEPVAVISYELWQTRFGGASNAQGQTVRVNGRHLTIVGVAPREFQGTVLGLNFDYWIPATMAPEILAGSRELEDRSVRGYAVMGRLQENVSIIQAQSEVDTAMRRLAQAYPSTNATLRAEVLTFGNSPRGPQRFLPTALAVMQAVMLLLLLAVCGNTANLVLARASARQREIGVRLALGAGPQRILSLLLTETLVLGLFGAALGVAIAVWGTNALRAMPPLAGLPIKFQTDLDLVSLAFAVLLGIGSGLIFGLAPALQLARVDPLSAFRTGSRTASRSRMRNILMASQVALALLVLIVAGLFLESFLETRTLDTGFRRDGVLLAAYDLTGRSTSQAFTRTFAAKLLDALRALPDVQGAAIASSVPLDIHGLPSRVFTVEGHTRTDADFDQALANTVTPGYFAVMDLPLRAGADFADLKDINSPPQAIVNEEFVRRYLANAEPLGRRLTARGKTFTIVGVVRNSLYNAFGEPPTPAIYFSYRDSPTLVGEVHLSARSGNETALAQDVRRVVRDLDPDLPVYNVRTLNTHIETNLVFRRVPARLFAVLGPLILVLAAIGIYAVVAYAMSLRTSEIGVRLALGATGRRLVAQFVAESLAVVSVGMIAGWLIAFIAAIDLLAGDSIDPRVFGGVPALLLAVAAIACWLPARRAARVDPIAALRQE
jgi:predicted permease